jgi:hypothetical protein
MNFQANSRPNDARERDERFGAGHIPSWLRADQPPTGFKQWAARCVYEWILLGSRRGCDVSVRIVDERVA